MFNTAIDIIYIFVAVIGVIFLTCITVKLSNRKNRGKTKNTEMVKDVDDYQYSIEEV